eukprot:21444-Prorocentrum_minimum.AAC.1
MPPPQSFVGGRNLAIRCSHLLICLLSLLPFWGLVDKRGVPLAIVVCACMCGNARNRQLRHFCFALSRGCFLASVFRQQGGEEVCTRGSVRTSGTSFVCLLARITSVALSWLNLLGSLVNLIDRPIADLTVLMKTVRQDDE